LAETWSPTAAWDSSTVVDRLTSETAKTDAGQPDPSTSVILPLNPLTGAPHNPFGPAASPAPPTGAPPPSGRPAFPSPTSGVVAPGYGGYPGVGGGTSPKKWIALGAVAVIAAVFFGVYELTGSGDKSSSSAASGSANPVSVRDVSPCGSPPALQARSVTFGADGLTVNARITPSCSGGDLLTNNRFRVTVVDSAGRDVAAGYFNLASTPIAVGSGGTATGFTFPPGTYWRTKESIRGDVSLTSHNDGSDSAPSGYAAPVAAVTATSGAAPASGDVDAAARSALADIASADRAYIDANLLEMWQPQLSSKRPGLFADGISWSAAEIVREHLALRQRFPGARLVWSGDWPVYGDPTWWITLAGVPFGSGEQANGWCAAQGFDADHCFAKILSHSRGSSGTTLNRK
jgi:hypothetical protein